MIRKPTLLLVACLFSCPSLFGQTPRILEQKLQKIDGEYYFYLAIETPLDWDRSVRPADFKLKTQPYEWARLPLLLSVDDSAHVVYPIVPYAEFREMWVPPFRPEFVGKLKRLEKVTRFKFHYPPDRSRGPESFWARQKTEWKILDVEVAFAIPAEGTDLRKVWQLAETAHCAVLERQTPAFGFFPFARAAWNRSHGLATTEMRADDEPAKTFDVRTLYEIMTGSAPIVESLALTRMQKPSAAPEARTVLLSEILWPRRGTHPWEKMLGDKRPVIESLADFVPPDNYYLHFADLAKLAELSELLDTWGTIFRYGWEEQARDYRLQHRLEQQLCLKFKTLPHQILPQSIKGVAVTGSDPYFREGTDVTAIFHFTDAKPFLELSDKQVREARAKFGDRTVASTRKYEGIAIESQTTPWRELSMHRAVLGDFVVLSNSPKALERVIDARKRRRNLGAEPSFHYMRKLLQLGDKNEDVFVFLPDDFVLKLLGPEMRIKEQRRLQAMTSLNMATHAALFAAWNRGVLPKDHAELLAFASLKQADLYVPGGNGVQWDARKRVAVSDVYGTLHFMTPLLELPMERVTEMERKEYDLFLKAFERDHRHYLDSVALRLSLDKKRVRAEAYVWGPVDGNFSTKNFLVQMFGDATIAFDKSQVEPSAALHLAMRFRVPKDRKGPGEHRCVEIKDSAFVERSFALKEEVDLGPTKTGKQQEGPVRTEKDLMLLMAYLSLSKPESSEKEKEHALEFILTVLQEKLEASVMGWLKSLNQELRPRTIVPKNEPLAAADAAEVNFALYLQPQLPHTRAGLQRMLEWEAHRRALPNANIYYVLRRAGVISAKEEPQAMRDAAYHWFGCEAVNPDGSWFEPDATSHGYRSDRHGSWRQPVRHESIDAKSPLDRLLNQFGPIRVTIRLREAGIHAIITTDFQPK